LIRAGQDLIWTFTHSTEGSCPLCLPWLGRVLSLTGQTTGIAEITDAQGTAHRIEIAGTLGPRSWVPAPELPVLLDPVPQRRRPDRNRPVRRPH
jgi:hypothetical protein